jgi:GcrA cell cycle regulator
MWNDERIDRLKGLWAEGLPASQIATELGITRNAVIGKSHRLKLAGRPKHNPLTVRTGPRRAATPRVYGVEPDAGLRCSIHQLTADKCRWPHGDPQNADFAYCGAPAPGVYCDYHDRIGHQHRRAA